MLVFLIKNRVEKFRIIFFRNNAKKSLFCINNYFFPQKCFFRENFDKNSRQNVHSTYIKNLSFFFLLKISVDWRDFTQ